MFYRILGYVYFAIYLVTAFLLYFYCNQIGTVFVVMSSWIALTLHPGIKLTFYTKYIKSEYISIFIMKMKL